VWNTRGNLRKRIENLRNSKQKHCRDRWQLEAKVKETYENVKNIWKTRGQLRKSVENLRNSTQKDCRDRWQQEAKVKEPYEKVKNT
jgi:uncharacterized protein YjbJ (UPF0337 family)